jgi:GAF domain-containing protein
MYLIQQQMDSLRDAGQLRDSETRKILAIAEVGRAIAGTRNLNYLLRQVVDLIVERFEVHYVQLFLAEEASGSAVLKAATGTAGSELVSQGYEVPSRSQSAVSRVMEIGDAIIVSDIRADSTYQYSNVLPNTRSEIVLPLRTGGQVIGVLDIQSTDAEAFAATEVSGFQAMADQIAIAIENVRLYERAQHDLQDIESLNRQLTGESWHKFLAGRPSAFALGYETSERGVRPLEVKEISQAAPRDDGTVTLPLKVRGETIGLLDLTPRSGREPDEETRAMLEAVAERVAMALDSTRLGDQSQYQAEREEILSQLSAELQATTDLNTILRVVSRTASRALETPTGFVHLTIDYGVEQKKEDTK